MFIAFKKCGRAKTTRTEKRSNFHLEFDAKAEFLMAGVPSWNKIYRKSAIAKVHAAVHLLQKSECTRHTLPTEYTLCFYIDWEVVLFLNIYSEMIDT